MYVICSFSSTIFVGNFLVWAAYSMYECRLLGVVLFLMTFSAFEVSCRFLGVYVDFFLLVKVVFFDSSSSHV